MSGRPHQPRAGYGNYVGPQQPANPRYVRHAGSFTRGDGGGDDSGDGSGGVGAGTPLEAFPGRDDRPPPRPRLSGYGTSSTAAAVVAPSPLDVEPLKRSSRGGGSGRDGGGGGGGGAGVSRGPKRPSPLLTQPPPLPAARVRPSPLDRSVVNPFGASSPAASAFPAPSVSAAVLERQGLLSSTGGAGSGGTLQQQVQLRRYGSGGGGGGDEAAAWGARDRTVSGGGGDHAIFLKNGVKLVEAAEIRLEALPTLAAWSLFLLPYALLVLAVWLDASAFGTTVRTFPPGASPCSGAECSWTVLDAPAATKFFRLQVQFTPTPDATHFPLASSGGDGDAADAAMWYTVGADVVVEVPASAVEEESSGDGSGGGAGGGGTGTAWRAVYTRAAEDAWQVVKCRPGDVAAAASTASAAASPPECDAVTLLHLIFDSPGLLGRYDAYRISVKVAVAADASGTRGDGAAALVAGATFTLASESTAYEKLMTVLRLALLAASAVAAGAWVRAACTQERRGTLVAEAKWMCVMLSGLMCWQNPLLAVLEWAPLPSHTAVSARLQVASEMLQCLGQQLLWAVWVVVIDAQRFTRWPRKAGGGSGVGATLPSPLDSRPYAAKDHSIPHHDPRSEFFCDFIVLKVLYALLGLLVSAGLCLLRHPLVLRHTATGDSGGSLEAPPAAASAPWWEAGGSAAAAAYVALSAAAAAIAAGWVMWFLRAAWRAGRTLRGQPFMPTRRQQLTYRVLMGQVTLLLLLLGAALAANLAGIAVYAAHHTSLSALGTTWRGGVGSEALAAWSWARGFRLPLGALVFISCVVYAQVYLFLPPRHSVSRTHDRLFVAAERDLPPRDITRRYRDSKELRMPLFCLETAALLCEAAWQSYYAPPSHSVPDPADLFGPARQELAYLGLTLVDFVHSDAKQTRAVLCRGADRLVLAFRGTAHLSNVASDFNMIQTALPPLRREGSQRIVIPLPSQAGANGNGDDEEGAAAWAGHRPSRSFSAMSDDIGGGGGAAGDAGWSSRARAEDVADAGSGLRWRIQRGLTACLHRIPVARQALPRVHRGFWLAYDSVREPIMAALARELQREYAPLYICGHSLGGAMASLAAMDVVSNWSLPDPVVLYTYGAPRTGNRAWARRMDARVPQHFRVIADGDAVTGMPHWFLGTYHHCGVPVIVDSDRCGSFVIDPTYAERVFGAKPLTSLSVHPLSQYRECLEACMADEDLSEYVHKAHATAASAVGGLNGIGGSSGSLSQSELPDWLKERRKRP